MGFNMHLGCMHQKFRVSNSCVLVCVCNTVTNVVVLFVVRSLYLPFMMQFCQELRNGKLLLKAPGHLNGGDLRSVGGTLSLMGGHGQSHPYEVQERELSQAGSPGHFCFYADEIWLNQ